MTQAHLPECPGVVGQDLTLVVHEVLHRLQHDVGVHECSCTDTGNPDVVAKSCEQWDAACGDGHLVWRGPPGELRLEGSRSGGGKTLGHLGQHPSSQARPLPHPGDEPVSLDGHLGEHAEVMEQVGHGVVDRHHSGVPHQG